VRRLPSKTEKQRNYIFFLRGKYKNKSNTPEKDRWIWNSEWETIEEQDLETKDKMNSTYGYMPKVEHYERKQIERYQRKFIEGFGAGSELSVIEKVCSIVSKRTGKKFFVSPTVGEFHKSDEGECQGIFALSSDGEMLRFNWKAGGSSSQIISIDYWKRVSFNPDLTIVTSGENIVKIIDVITNVIHNPKPETFQLEEDINFTIPKNLGSGTKETSESINAWFREMQIDEHKLANTRISQLYKQSYLYWFEHVRTEKYKLVTDQTFRNYLIASFEKNNIKNIFMRSIQVKSASGEVVFPKGEAKKEFDQSIFAMTLQDTIEYLKASVRMVTRGHENAIVVCGSAGVGKSKLVKDVLIDDNVKYKTLSGGIKNTQSLFQVLKNNNEEHFILVFDDTDAVFDKNNLDIMKAALAPGNERIVTYYDPKFTDISKKNNPQIHFKSGVIIITNKSKAKIPSAILSRTAPIEIDVKIPEILDDIRINLENVLPQVPIKDKLEVLDFIQNVLKSQIKYLDYRLFERACIYQQSGLPQWKKFILPILR
jgi:hypothetical protein